MISASVIRFVCQWDLGFLFVLLFPVWKIDFYLQLGSVCAGD